MNIQLHPSHPESAYGQPDPHEYPAQSVFTACDKFSNTRLLAKDHDDLSFAFEISVLDIFDCVVCFTFTECCRVDTEGQSSYPETGRCIVWDCYTYSVAK